jgi:hypothetical protein
MTDSWIYNPKHRLDEPPLVNVTEGPPPDVDITPLGWRHMNSLERRQVWKVWFDRRLASASEPEGHGWLAYNGGGFYKCECGEVIADLSDGWPDRIFGPLPAKDVALIAIKDQWDTHRRERTAP